MKATTPEVQALFKLNMGFQKLWHRIFNVVTLATIMMAFHIGGGMQEVTIHHEANAFIGVIMQISERGSGVFGCGPPNLKGIIRYEAMRWILNILNKREENAFLPGITLGMRMFDTCGRSRVAVNQLAELLPSLKGVNDSFFIPSAIQLGLIDGAGLLEDPEVQGALEDIHFPALKLTSESDLMNAEEKARAIAAIIKELKWHHMVIIHGSDAYSAQLSHTLLEFATGDEELCFTSVEEFIVPKYFRTMDESTISAMAEMNQVVLNSVLSAANFEIPVLVLLQHSDIHNFLVLLNNQFSTTDTSMQMLFSSLLTHEDLFVLPKQITRLYSVATQVDALPHFEQYWKERLSLLKRNRIHLTQENEWLWKYIKESKQYRCGEGQADSAKLDKEYLCSEDDDNGIILEDDLEIALHAEEVLAGTQPLVIFAQALRQAWEALCFSRDTVPCSDLYKMTHREFHHVFLSSVLEDQLYGPKLPESDRDWLKEPGISIKLRLVQYMLQHETDGPVTLNKILEFSLSEGVQILEPLNKPLSVEACKPTSSQNCTPCLQISSDRTVSSRHLDLTSYRNKVVQDASHTSKHRIQNLPEDYQVLVSSPQNVYIVALFSVHKTTTDNSLLHCKDDEINLDSVRQLEAFLWALNRLNTIYHSSYGLKIGALLIDTCNSRVRTMMLSGGLEALFNKYSRHNNYHILAIINALPTQEAILANDILSQMNISSLATGQAAAIAHAGSKESKYIFQVEASLSTLVEATINILRYLGWNYISVIYSANDGDYYTGYKLFLDAARKNEICLALEEGISLNTSANAENKDVEINPELVAHLVGARARGARGVLLWIHPEHIQALMRLVSQEIAQGSLRKEDLFWLVADPNGQASQVLRKFGNILGGSGVLRPLHKPIPELLHHLQQLQRGAKEVSGNPWLTKYLQKDLQCSNPECQLFLERGGHGDYNTVQAVSSVGTAISAVVSQLCNNSSSSNIGFCLNLYPRNLLQEKVNQQLHKSTIKKADGTSNEEFRFTEFGMGNVPIEILNTRRNYRSRSHSLGNIYFERVGQYHETKLQGVESLLAYRDTGDEVRVTSLASQCSAYSKCPKCRKHQDTVSVSDWVTMTKPQENSTRETNSNIVLHIAATFNVHEPSQNPLECSGEISRQGIEQLEAFLWAIDQVNRNNSQMSLAAIALDTCGSIVKTSRDVSNFLSLHASDLYSVKDVNKTNIVAVLAGGDTEQAASVTDAVGHLEIAVLAPQAGGPPSQRKKYAPYPLQLAPSHAVQASSLLALLEYLDWRCFTVIYYQDGIEYEDMFRYVEKNIASFSNLKLTGGIPVPLASLNTTALIRKCLLMLRAQMEGTRVVVLMLPSERLELIFRVVRALEDESQIVPGDFSWIMFTSEQNIEFSEYTYGALILQPKAGRVAEFEHHFRSLSLNSNSWNPWFAEFWSNVFHCRGASCYSNKYTDLQSYQFTHNPSVVNTINAVLAVSHALGTVKRELCSDGTKCNGMKDVERVRKRLFEVTPNMAFVGVGLNAVAFSNSGENSHADIEVLNIHHLENNGKPVNVGYISATRKVKLDTAKLKIYADANRNEIPFSEMHTACQNSHGLEGQGTPQVIEIASTAHVNNSRLSLLGIASVHQQGSRPFRCGKLHPASFIHTAALHYALNSVNHNSSMLPGIDLSAILFDSCLQPTRAYNSVYNFLTFPKEALKAMTIGLEVKTRPEDVVAAFILDYSAAETVSSLLNAQNIAPHEVAMEGYAHQRILLSRKGNKDSHLLRENLVQTILSVARATHSHSLVVVHGTSVWAELLNQQLLNHTQIQSSILCLAGVYGLQNKNTFGAISSADLKLSNEIIKTLKPGTLVLLLLENPDEIQAFLDICHNKQGLVFLTVLQTWNVNSYAGHTIFSLHQVFEYDANITGLTKDFQKWLITNLLSAKDRKISAIPESWIQEFEVSNDYEENSWNVSKRIQDMFLMNDFASGIQENIKSVWNIAKILQKFFSTHCKENRKSSSFSECFTSNKSQTVVRIREYVKQELARLLPSGRRHNPNIFNLWYGPERVGVWERGVGLMLSNTIYFQNYQTFCTGNCTLCDQQGVAVIHNLEPTVYENFQYPWAAAVGGLTLFGAFLTILIALYFLAAAALPNNNMCGGTSILGYLMLLGLLMLFTANLSFVLAPTEATCGARRFLPGFAYAIVFSGMLLKVFTTWRISNSTKPVKGLMGRPFGLLTLAMALIFIQILVAGSWLLLIPPETYIHQSREMLFSRCYPSGHFESHLLLSLVYVILLITATATVALFCCSGSKLEGGDEHQLTFEARWIMLASILVATVFTFWGMVTIAMISASHADLASSIAHLIAAMVLLLCLYVPKLCLYNRLRSGKSSPQSNFQQFYEISHFRSQTLKTLPAFIPPPPIITMGSPKINDDDAASDDPTQIVPSSLYSLDMFSQTSSSQGQQQDRGDEDEGEHCEPGSNEFMVSQNAVLMVDRKELSLQSENSQVLF